MNQQLGLRFFFAAILVSVFPFVAATRTTVLGQQPVPYRPAVGKPHNDFTLPSIEDGLRIRLADFRGKKLLLFHFASW